MAKPKLDYWIDALMGLSFIVAVISGIVLLFFRILDAKGSEHEMFLGLVKHNWLIMHDLSGLIFVILVVTHFILHWHWVKQMTKRILQLKEKAEISED